MKTSLFLLSLLLSLFVSSLGAQTNSTNSSKAGTAYISGKPPVRVAASISWTDESVGNTNISGYNVYCGTNSLAMPLVVTLTNGQWLKTNGAAVITLSNFLTSVEYYISVNAFGQLVSWDESAESTNIDFIAPGYILPSFAGYNVVSNYSWLTTNGTGTNSVVVTNTAIVTNLIPTNIVLNFMCFSNHSYTVQSRYLVGASNSWSARQTFSNAQGVVGFADSLVSNRIYRLKIQ